MCIEFNHVNLEQLRKKMPSITSLMSGEVTAEQSSNDIKLVLKHETTIFPAPTKNTKANIAALFTFKSEDGYEVGLMIDLEDLQAAAAEIAQRIMFPREELKQDFDKASSMVGESLKSR